MVSHELCFMLQDLIVEVQVFPTKKFTVLQYFNFVIFVFLS